jgi:hypothetical protein
MSTNRLTPNVSSKRGAANATTIPIGAMAEMFCDSTNAISPVTSPLASMLPALAAKL